MLMRWSVPEAGRRGGGDGDAALALLVHPVHRRRALMHLTGPVNAAGVEEDALGRRRLARVDVGDDADVAGLRQRRLGVGRRWSWSRLPYSLRSLRLVVCRRAVRDRLRAARLAADGCDSRSLVAVVREGAVRLGHAVRIFTALDRRAGVVEGVEQLVGQLLLHRLARRGCAPTSAASASPATAGAAPRSGPAPGRSRHRRGAA